MSARLPSSALLRLESTLLCYIQCSESVTFWYGSGSADPYFWLTDPDPSVKFKTSTKFFAYYFLKVHLRHSSKIKVIKMSQNSENQGFSHYFAWWWKDPDPDSYLWLTDQCGPKVSRSGTPIIVSFVDPDPHRFCSDFQPFYTAFVPMELCIVTYYRYRYLPVLKVKFYVRILTF